jgi:tight adherence protein B
MSVSAILVAAVSFIVVLGIFFILSRVLSRSESGIENRLDQFVSREVEKKPKDESEERTPSMVAKGLDQAVAGRGFAQNIATDLARANMKLTVGEYLILIVVSILGTGVLAYLIMHQNLFLTFGGLVLGFFLPRFYVKYLQGKRLTDFNNQLGDAINLLANGLRSGYSLLQAMDAVSREMSPPMSEEYQRVVREIGLGLSNERAMNNMLRRIPSDDLDLMITAVNVQHEVGGNLAEILETISHTIRERIRIKGEIKVLTAQGMISGYVISFLPVGLGLVLFAMNPNYMGAMFKEPCGWAMIAVGVVLITVGFIAIRKIVNIEV